MKTEIETIGAAEDLTYPCLMLSPKGAIILYVANSQGTVLHSTKDSNWEVGDEVRNDVKQMAIFCGNLRLSN